MYRIIHAFPTGYDTASFLPQTLQCLYTVWPKNAVNKSLGAQIAAPFSLEGLRYGWHIDPELAYDGQPVIEQPVLDPCARCVSSGGRKNCGFRFQCLRVLGEVRIHETGKMNDQDGRLNFWFVFLKGLELRGQDVRAIVSIGLLYSQSLRIFSVPQSFKKVWVFGRHHVDLEYLELKVFIQWWSNDGDCQALKRGTKEGKTSSTRLCPLCLTFAHWNASTGRVWPHLDMPCKIWSSMRCGIFEFLPLWYFVVYNTCCECWHILTLNTILTIYNYYTYHINLYHRVA